MFERFTERARQVVVLAQEEARRLRHNYIGTEHLLLGLLREEDGVAAAVLRAHRLDVESVRERVVRIVGGGEEVTSGQIPFTPRAKKVMELSLREALGLGHDHIGTEHLLIGLARENDGVAARILADCGIHPEVVIDDVTTKLLEGQPPERGADRPLILDRLARLIETYREADRQLHGDDTAAMAYAAGAVNALREVKILTREDAQDWLRRIRPAESGSEDAGEFTGRVLERLVAAPEQPADGFRVVGVELYRDGCIARVRVPSGGTLPVDVELSDAEGTGYRLAEPPEWHGSEGVLGELVFVPHVPESVTELRLRAHFADGTGSETAIPL